MRTIPRSIIAFGLFVLVSASTIGVVGHVQAGDEILPGVPVDLDTLVLPEPRIGDRWTYTRLDTRTGDLLRDAQHPERTMTWLPPVVTVAADGTAWRTPLLSHAYDDMDSTISASAVHPVDGTTIGHYTYAGGRGGNDNTLHRLEGENWWAFASASREPGPLCATMIHLLAPRIDMDQGFAFPACSGGLLDHGRTIHMEPVGAYRAGDHTYAVFDNEGPGGDLERVVFRTDLPVPTLIVKRTHAEPHAVALTAFSRGIEPVLAHQEPLYRLPPLESAPLHPWGLDDRGVEHPYPLSAAWDDAWQDPEHPLRPFMQQHPDAGIHAMYYDEREEDDAVRQTWHWSLSGDQRQERFCQSREEKRPPHDQLDPVQALVEEDRPQGCDDLREATQPEPGSVGPTVASLQEAWRVHARAHAMPEGPIYWSIDDGRFTVGVHWTEAERDETSPLDGDETRWQRASITFTEDGTVDLVLRTFSSLQYTVLATDRQQEDDEVVLTPQEAGPTQPVPVWVFPALQDAVALSVLALLLAALYWLFPHLKHGILTPLFSRIQRDRALDNEARATLVAAVEAEPGIHDRELQRRTGLARGQLGHHLDKLVHTGILSRQRSEGVTAYWTIEGVKERTLEEVAALRAPLAREIHTLLQAEPHLTLSELARRLDKRRQTVSYHVRRLRAAGLLPS